MGVVEIVVVEHRPQVKGHLCMTRGSVVQSVARDWQRTLSSREQSSCRVVDAVVVVQSPHVYGQSRCTLVCEQSCRKQNVSSALMQSTVGLVTGAAVVAHLPQVKGQAIFTALLEQSPACRKQKVSSALEQSGGGRGVVVAHKPQVDGHSSCTDVFVQS